LQTTKKSQFKRRVARAARRRWVTKSRVN
jgi:hypothetical protein